MAEITLQGNPIHTRGNLPEKGTVVYTQQVPEIVDEPDYEAALAVLK